MARKPGAPGPAIPPATLRRIEAALSEIAGAVIADYFFDPDREDTYKALLASRRGAGEEAIVLTREEVETDQGETIDIELLALRAWTMFRLTVTGRDCAASIEGAWNFGAEELRQAQVQVTAGRPNRVAAVLEEAAAAFDDSALDDFESLLSTSSSDDEADEADTLHATRADMSDALHAMLDELAGMAEEPFAVMEALYDAPIGLPDDTRSFAATEIGLSHHAALRETLPLMLLDPSSAVRRHVAQTLEQIAVPDRLSPVMLRRMIGVRNWMPAADRPSIDAAIRKARMVGVETARWPQASADLQCRMSLLDGAGTQSIFLFDRSAAKSLFGGIAIRFGFGFVDLWLDTGLPRRDVNRMIKEAGQAMPMAQVPIAHVGRIIEHTLATGLAANAVPPIALLRAAEISGAAWQDRRLDIAAESESALAALPARMREAEALAELLARTSDQMDAQPLFQSWHEDEPAVQKRLRRLRQPRAVLHMLEEVLPAARMDWAERFLMVGLTLQEAAEPSLRAQAPAYLATAQALTAGRPLQEIPAMGWIARQSFIVATTD